MGGGYVRPALSTHEKTDPPGRVGGANLERIERVDGFSPGYLALFFAGAGVAVAGALAVRV